MKAQDLLTLVRESSKGSKSVEGELSMPSYDNLNTPNNHVDGKGSREVKNAKKDFGKKRDMRNPANPGKPKKGEKRGMEGPGATYARMNEDADLSAVKQRVYNQIQDLDVDQGTITVIGRGGRKETMRLDPRVLHRNLLAIRKATDSQTVSTMWQQILRAGEENRGRAGTVRHGGGGRSVGKPMSGPEIAAAGQDWTLADSEGEEKKERRVRESYATSDSMAAKQPVKKGGPVSKPGKVRSKVDDEPANKGDPGKPKTTGKEEMGPGANLGRIMNPKKLAQVREGVKGLEKLLGRRLNLGPWSKLTRKRPSFNEGTMSLQEAMDPVLYQYLRTALWSSTDEDGEELHNKYGVDDFAPEAVAQAQRDIRKFQHAAGRLLDGQDMTSVAHDLWLTRNHHGSGFWDGDYDTPDQPDLGEKLTKIAHAMGEVNPYVGDDGHIYLG